MAETGRTGESVSASTVLSDVDLYVKAFSAGAPSRQPGQPGDRLPDADPDAPMVLLVDALLQQALADRASDMHIEPREHDVRVRFRVDGAMRTVVLLPADMRLALVSRVKVMANMDIVERRRSQDGQLTLDVGGREVDIRVATTATIWGEKCVLRLLDKTRRLLRLNELGMTDETAAEFSSIVRNPFGMVLCAGPTGSGKTTTLFATLAEIDHEDRNIMTIEDPVEYVVDSINQIQINEHAGLTFSDGLRSILRQDPDIILVGEIRDIETAKIAVQSALTGHMVLSCVHAIDTVAALHRFLDMGIEMFLITSSVLAVVAQRLLRRLCDQCRTLGAIPDDQRDFYLQAGGTPRDLFPVAAGCDKCAGTGYHERIGAYELLSLTPEIKRMLVGGATHDEIQRAAVQQGTRTLMQESIALVEQDVTSVAEVLRGVVAG